MKSKKNLLLLTDFAYEAKGREYFREDVELSIYLRKYFNVFVSDIQGAEKLLDNFDVILLRNTGPQVFHYKELMTLRKRSDLLISNDLCGKGDINGKYHLLELYKEGFPVIPSYASKDEIPGSHKKEKFLIKPLDGADSCGQKILNYSQITQKTCRNAVIQPLLKFQYEISFYFIGQKFYYALYAPDVKKRWQLKLYKTTKKDRDFAQQFIQWNSCKFGIQRVDACKLTNGQLLLMELEDYNPFLSLDTLPKNLRNPFLEGLCQSLIERVEKKSKSIS